MAHGQEVLEILVLTVAHVDAGVSVARRGGVVDPDGRPGGGVGRVELVRVLVVQWGNEVVVEPVPEVDAIAFPIDGSGRQLLLGC